jgi:hypothetical protein
MATRVRGEYRGHLSEGSSKGDRMAEGFEGMEEGEGQTSVFLQVNDKERQKRWVRWEGRAVAVVVSFV